MKKILKYLIGLLFCTSLLVTLIPFMEVQETDICMMDLFRAMATGNYTSASEYVLEAIQEFLTGPFIMAMAILITILLCAVYMFVSGWKSSYIIALSGAVIVNGEVALLAWRLYTDVYIAIKDSVTLSLLFDSINIKILPLYVWCIIYVLIIAGSIWGIIYIVRDAGEVKKAVLSEVSPEMTDPYDAEWDMTPEVPEKPEWNSDPNKEMSMEEELSEDDIMTEIADLDMIPDDILRCPQCGSELDEEAVFCGICGFKLK